MRLTAGVLSHGGQAEAVHAGEGQVQVLLHRAQTQVLGVQVDQRAQQSGRTLAPELPAAPQTALLHPATRGACRDRLLVRLVTSHTSAILF